MIKYLEKFQQFDLLTVHNQLSLGILKSGHVVLLYLGKRLGTEDLSYITKEIQRASYLADTDHTKDFKLEQYPLVWPTYGNPDMRTPAIHLQYPNGSRISDFRYKRHDIYPGKKKIAGLPASFGRRQVETLDLFLEDALTNVQVKVSISAFEAFDVFTQHIEIINRSIGKLAIERVMSLNLDFLRDDFDLMTLSGAWGRETHIKRNALKQGFQGIDSKRGASGHGQNPFMALLDKNTSEDQGKVYAVDLVYSGNFLAQAEVDMHQNTRLQIGIDPFDFHWQLDPDETFYSPEAVIVFAEAGLNQMSQRFHRFFEQCLIAPFHAEKTRPIILNNWEATYFNFNKELLLDLASKAQSVGIELFVLDDGWFGRRDGADSSLGDWVPYQEKIGGTLTELIQEINSIGLDFGLWVEPEMVSEKSRLFEEHPDWIIAVPNRIPQQVRDQYVLDISRKEVQDHLVEVLDELLTANNIRLLKWDMNRNVTDSYSRALTQERQQELGHRYILGLYRILDKITKKHPDVWIESCAGGGGRFDAGMLYYTPQIWTSDDTDAVERLQIQKGTAMVYPPSALSCHVSAVPNHQVGRITSIETRGIVAMQGILGYELNLLETTAEENQTIKEQIAYYKKYREIFQFGQLSVLPTYEQENATAWMKEKAGLVVVSYVQTLAKPNTVPKRLRLSGLIKEADYLLEGTKDSFKGSELMEIGLPLARPAIDYFAQQWVLRKQ